MLMPYKLFFLLFHIYFFTEHKTEKLNKSEEIFKFTVEKNIQKQTENIFFFFALLLLSIIYQTKRAKKKDAK